MGGVIFLLQGDRREEGRGGLDGGGKETRRGDEELTTPPSWPRVGSATERGSGLL